MRTARGSFLFLSLLLVCASPVHALPGGNRLALESSPYLQLHKTDPVHWRAWGEAALKEARKLNRPILLSIGYTACHWCHVMQRESYADPKTATLINTLFVPVIIDREERPALDSQFQWQAVHLGLPTGWPLTLFLTPEGQPFFGGAYYPPVESRGMLAFKDLLGRVSKLYTDDPAEILKHAKTAALNFQRDSQPKPGAVLPAHQKLALKSLIREIDPLAGGFGEAPKHPEWAALMLLWRGYIQYGDPALKEAVTDSLSHMIDGGFYDHVGGGFFRYATDPLWQTPHFEKMIDVNAGLLRLMTEVWRETQDPVLENRIRNTIVFVLREMALPSGAFASSLDADSENESGEGEEGAFYLWNNDEIGEVLDGQTDIFLETFDLGPTEGGAIDDDEDRGILFRHSDTRTDEALEKLRQHRANRTPPFRDEKIIADGNGMMIRALGEAGLAMDERKWIDAAGAAFDAVTLRLTNDHGRLCHSAIGGRHSTMATTSGLASMAGAALTLFEATGRKTYLDKAAGWVRTALDHHLDTSGGGFFAAADDAKDIPLRMKPVIDDPNPSGNAAMIEVLARLYYLSGEAQWRIKADATLGAVGSAVINEARGVASLLSAAQTLDQAVQVVIIGTRKEPGTKTLLSQVMKRSLPDQILEIVPPGTTLPKNHPARYKTQVDNQPTAYVCKGTICSLPTTTVETLDETLVFMRAQKP